MVPTDDRATPDGGEAAESAEQSFARRRAQLDELLARLDALRVEIADRAGAFYAEWVRHEARERVRDEANVAAALPPEELAALKREVEEIAVRSPAHVREQLGSAVAWWHLDPHPRRDRRDSAAPAFLFGAATMTADEGGGAPVAFGAATPPALRDAVEALGAPLARAFAARGFLKRRRNSHGPDEVTHLAPRPDEWPEAVRRLFHQYAEGVQVGEELAAEVAALRQEVERERIGRLWDSL